MTATRPFSPIAIVAMGAMFPGRGTTEGFWRDLIEGADTIGDIPRTHWLAQDYLDPDPTKPDKTYCARGAFLRPFAFDPIAHGTPPRVVETTDTVQLIALSLADSVLKEAEAGLVQGVDRERISVILGVAAGTEMMQDMASRLGRPQWIAGMREHGLSETEAARIADSISAYYGAWRESTFPGLLANVVAGRIANRLDLGGTNFTADAACASSLAAVKHAISELHEGDSDLVLTGGADALNAIFMYMCFSKTPAMSATGVCRPFAENADGTLMGEGAALFALRRLEDAERDGNEIHAVIRGIGAASDGRATSVYAPRSSGQARAIRRAFDKAQVEPRTIGLVEAHGTGTRAGDLAEVGGLREAFGDPDGSADERAWCALGSVKSQIGHTKSAAGAASLAKCVLALRHKVLPPTINVSKPDPRLSLDRSAFYLNTEARPWIAAPELPRRASLSSFGFGGSNYHAVLEEYSGAGQRPPRIPALPAELFLVSADSLSAAADRVTGIAAALNQEEDLALAASKSRSEFDPAAPIRVVLVAATAQDVTRLAPSVARDAPHPPGLVVVTSDADESRSGSLGFLFSGQGSQYVGMGRDLALHFEAARAVWDQFAHVQTTDGRPLHQLVFPPPAWEAAAQAHNAAALTDTAHAQPALAMLALAQAALLDKMNVTPDAVAGHSFGEVMALAEAGVVDAAEAVELAVARGAAMAEAATGSGETGAMTAVFAGRDQIETLLNGADVVIANDNGPNQVVLSGAVSAIEQVEAALGAAGLRLKRLDVSTAFHSPLVANAAESFAAKVAAVAPNAAEIPVFANTTGAPYPTEPHAFADVLAQQLAKPVRFRDMVEQMYEAGIRTFVEVGPSGSLTSLVSDILGTRAHRVLALDRKGRNGVASFLEAAGTLAALGYPIDLAALLDDVAPPLPRPAPASHELLLTGANYNKPYPKDVPTEGHSPPHRSLPDEVAKDQSAAQDGQAIDAPRFSTPSPPFPVTSTPAVARPDAAPAPAARARASHVERSSSPVPHKPPSASDNFGQILAQEHRHFVDTLAGVHRDFIASMERIATGVHAGAPAPTIAPVAPPVALPTPGTVAPEPVPTAPSPFASVEATRPSVPPPAEDAPSSPPAQVAPPLTSPNTALEFVRDIVARETGYPAEMLEPQMDLEADLGIDSIKQVEIFAALREAVPDLPEIDQSRFAEIRTIAAVAEVLGETQPAAAPAAPIATSDSVDMGDPLALVRDIVARETGYPAEMLEPQMDLEADLGIDSIKQVEIFAALREAVPDLPEIDQSRFAEIRTIASVAEVLGETQPVSTPVAETTPIVPAAGIDDPLALVRDIVARETGYPAEMLEPQMDLEADLGIDSIKQVEIFAALREAVPDLPEIDQSRFAEIRTIAAVAEVLSDPTTATDGAAVAPHLKIVSGTAPEPLRSEPTAPAVLLRSVVVGEKLPEADAADPKRWGTRAEVTSDAPEIAGAIVQALQAQGITGVLVEDPSGDVPFVVSTAGLATDLDPLAKQSRALAAARAVAEPFAQSEGSLFVLLEDTGAPPAREVAAGQSLSGLARTAAREWSAATVRSIGFEAGSALSEDVADRLVTEMLSIDAPIVTRLTSEGGRSVEAHHAAPALIQTPLTLPREAFIVASGGARGITADCVARLAQMSPIRVLALGRTAPVPWPNAIDPDLDEKALRTVLAQERGAEGTPPDLHAVAAKAAQLVSSREINRTVEALRAGGSDLVYATVDVTDKAAVAAAIEQHRAAWGPVQGLIHGAGVLADRRIADKTDADLARVYAPKVTGFANLLAAVGSDPLAFLALFSSVAALVGNPGQADYAMANVAAECMAQAYAAQNPETRVRIMAWGPWQGGMVDETVAARFEAEGVGLIDKNAGAEAFVTELNAGGAGVVHSLIAAPGASSLQDTKAS